MDSLLSQAGGSENISYFTGDNSFFVPTSLKLPEYVHAPPGHSREEPWGKVSCRVDWVAAVQTHGHSDGQDDQADAQRLHAFWSADILLVSDGQDAQDQSASCNYLENTISTTTVIFRKFKTTIILTVSNPKT